MRPFKLAAILIALPFISFAQQNVIHTIAGTGTQGYTGDGGAAQLAELNYPHRAEVDSAGNVYFFHSSDMVIRKVAPSAQITTILSGTSFGYLSDIALDRLGNLYIAGENRLRKVDATTGIMTTICGDGNFFDIGDGGPATAANIIGPFSVTVDNAGNIYLGTSFRIRKIDAVTGIITTICGDGTGSVNSGLGGPAVNAKIGTVYSMTTDDAGNLYFANNDNFIGKIDVNGIFSKVAGDNASGYTGDGGPAITASITPTDIEADKNGNLFFTDMHGHVRMISTQGNISTIAGKPIAYMPSYSGDGGDALQAEMSTPRGIGLDTCGNLYIADYGNHRIRKVSNSCGTLNVKKTINTPLSFSIAPNPVSSELTITASEKIAHIAVYDVTGRTMLQLSTNREKATIDVKALPSGIYFLKLNNALIRKFVKE